MPLLQVHGTIEWQQSNSVDILLLVQKNKYTKLQLTTTKEDLFKIKYTNVKQIIDHFLLNNFTY